MPTDGLEYLVTYSLQGPAGTDKEVNQADLRGINKNAATKLQHTQFDRMSGTRTQDVQVTLPNGMVYQALGMNKTRRFAGLTNFMTLEPATYSATDAKGNAICGAKVRLDFNRNLLQYVNLEQRDFQSLWYYDIPCKQQGTEYLLDTQAAKLRALVLNEVWQFRLGGKSSFFNWGHSVTIVNGPPSQLPGGWWTHWDLPNTKDDALGAADMLNRIVRDLENSSQKWLEFTSTGEFRESYLIYSAADADQYATFDRQFLNRQREYAVFYRPNGETPWDYIRIQPLYNKEWNDLEQNLRAIKGWFLNDHLTKDGRPREANDDVVKEIERRGFMNAPNTELDQIRWLDSAGKPLYVMTVRAHIGASDTLIMFGKAEPDYAKRTLGTVDNQPRPLVYDENGKVLSHDKQPYNAEQWAEWMREATFWNFIKDNPSAMGSEFQIQYRFADNSRWEAIVCGSGDSVYTCGYRPILWDLSMSYYMQGNPRNAWLASQLLGEVGVRTLGLSYASGRYEGTGLIFAMAQMVHRQEFFSGFNPESIYVFDARAAQLPDRLAESWKALHS